MKFLIAIEATANDIPGDQVRGFLARLLAITKNELCGLRVTADDDEVFLVPHSAVCMSTRTKMLASEL